MVLVSLCKPEKVLVLKRVLTGAFLSVMGHIYTAACQGLLSPLQKAAVILIYKYIIWVFVLSLAHKRACSHTACSMQIRVHALPGVFTQTQMQPACSLLRYSHNMNPENPLHVWWSLKAPMKKTFVSVLNPFKHCRRYWVMCESRTSATLHFHLYL